MIKHKNELINIKEAVVSKFDIGPSEEWKNRDFENLSFEINKVTSVLISIATLKRIFGKSKTNEDYFPQNATLEALCEYSGYVPNQKKKSNTPSFTPNTQTKRYALLSVIVLILITVATLYIRDNIKEELQPEAKLSVKEIEGAFQTSVKFDYEIKNNTKSIFLYLGEGESPYYLSPKRTSTNLFVRFPGYFNAKIGEKPLQKTLAQAHLLIPTDGWKAIAHYFSEKPVMRYYPILEKNWNDENIPFATNAKSLYKSGLDTTRVTTVRYENYKYTGCSGDNFELNTTMQSCDYWPAITCYSMYATIVGKEGKIRIKLSDKGCSAYSEYVLSEKKHIGKNSDLSFLCIDTHTPVNLRIKNRDKQVVIFLDDIKVIEESYNRSLGEIVGVSFEFHGAGSVQAFSLKNLKGDEIF